MSSIFSEKIVSHGKKVLEISSRDTEALYLNMELFMKGKKPNEQIFDGITSAKVNSFLRTIDQKNVPGLTAKVFRTYIATQIVKEALSLVLQYQ